MIFLIYKLCTGCPKKNAPMFKTAITPTKLALGIKVG